MSLVVLLILAVVWGVFLVPQVLRARAERGPADSIGSFRNQLSMIERSLTNGPGRVTPLRRQTATPNGYGAPAAVGGPVGVAPPFAPPFATAHRSRPLGAPVPSRAELQRRRQNVLLALLAAVVGTLALGLLFRPFFALNVVADLALVAYLTLLTRARTIAAEREVKVRYLPGPAAAQPAYAAERALRTVAR